MKTNRNWRWSFCVAVFFVLFPFQAIFSQGSYTKNFKQQIGKTFTDEKHISWLKGYSFREGSLITDVNDPEPQFITVLLKGTKGVVVYSAKPDTTKKIFYILDVIELRSIPKGWEIRTVGCQEGETEDQIIVALVNPGKREYVKTVKKAWLCERDRLKIEAISTKDIRCLNEGQE